MPWCFSFYFFPFHQRKGCDDLLMGWCSWFEDHRFKISKLVICGIREDSKDHREVVLAHCCSRSEPMRLNEWYFFSRLLLVFIRRHKGRNGHPGIASPMGRKKQILCFSEGSWEIDLQCLEFNYFWNKFKKRSSKSIYSLYKILSEPF